MSRRKMTAKGAPSWITTFSDLMNLLLCFFVLLFSMSTINEDKYTSVVESIQNSFGVFNQNNHSNISQNTYIPAEYNENEGMQDKKSKIIKSDEMKADMEEKLNEYEIQDYVKIDSNEQYVSLTLGGSLLFDSGSSQIRKEALPVVEKVGEILERYKENVIEIEGHTDNVPVTKGSKYEDNNVLSMYRALAVADYLRDHTDLSDALIKSSGRGEYAPVTDNATEEGRALNRRVEFKIYK